MAGAIGKRCVNLVNRRAGWTATSLVALMSISPAFATAGVLSWLDDVVQASVRKADPDLAAKRSGRLFARESAELGEDGLEAMMDQPRHARDCRAAPTPRRDSSF